MANDSIVISHTHPECNIGQLVSGTNVVAIMLQSLGLYSIRNALKTNYCVRCNDKIAENSRVNEQKSICDKSFLAFSRQTVPQPGKQQQLLKSMPKKIRVYSQRVMRRQLVV